MPGDLGYNIRRNFENGVRHVKADRETGVGWGVRAERQTVGEMYRMCGWMVTDEEQRGEGRKANEPQESYYVFKDLRLW